MLAPLFFQKEKEYKLSWKMRHRTRIFERTTTLWSIFLASRGRTRGRSV